MFLKKSIPFFLISLLFLSSCSTSRQARQIDDNSNYGTSKSTNSKAKTFVKPLTIDRKQFVAYAKTLLGTPYLYGSINPIKGLDCSGFVSNVFQHFGIAAPRVTKDYNYEGREVSRNQAKPGDIILFTGSDNNSGIVGHMGIITETKDLLMFVHSASGKKVGVILNALTGYYETHFVKIISVLE